MKKLTVILRNELGYLKEVKISSLEEGREKVLENTRNIGASIWYDANGCVGTVRQNGKPIARYSYNGRLWDLANKERTL